MRFIIYLVLGTVGIVLLNLGFYLHGVNTGAIYPLNRISVEVEQAKEVLQSADVVTPERIPTLSDYIIYTTQGGYIRGSIAAKEAQAIWSQAVENKEARSNAYQFTVVTRSEEILVLRYPTTAQFHSPVLRSLFPSADLTLIILVLIQLLLLLLAVAYWFGKYLKTRMDQLLLVVHKVENQDLDFDIQKTKLYEIDQVLDALEQMRQALKKSLAEQWRADKNRQEQIAALAHDLKTPMTIIRGNAELLYDTPLTEEQLECADYIQSSSIQVEQYLQILMEVTRSWDSYKIQIAPTALAEFVDELGNQAKGLCYVHNRHLVWDCNYVTAQMNMDRKLLMRALVNVVSNAVDHTPAGGTVRIQIQEEKGKLFFVIEDTGNGFSEEALKHAADSFFMADHSRNSKAHYGIGLYVADSVCRKHGGQLRLENTSDHGAKVTLAIPIG
jgi:signal transduction histidine kinase